MPPHHHHQPPQPPAFLAEVAACQPLPPSLAPCMSTRIRCSSCDGLRGRDRAWGVVAVAISDHKQSSSLSPRRKRASTKRKGSSSEGPSIRTGSDQSNGGHATGQSPDGMKVPVPGHGPRSGGPSHGVASLFVTYTANARTPPTTTTTPAQSYQVPWAGLVVQLTSIPHAIPDCSFAPPRSKLDTPSSE